MFGQTCTVGLDGDARHLDGIHRTLSPERVRLGVLVEQPNLREVQIEMPRFRGQVHRLERATTFLVHDVEALHESQEVAHFGVGAGSPAVVEITAECRATHRREDDIATANFQVVRGIARAQIESCRRQGQLFPDEPGVEAHHQAGVVNIGAGSPEGLAAAGVEKPHPLSFEYVERGLHDGLDLFCIENLDRRVRIHNGTPR